MKLFTLLRAFLESVLKIIVLEKKTKRLTKSKQTSRERTKSARTQDKIKLPSEDLTLDLAADADATSKPEINQISSNCIEGQINKNLFHASEAPLDYLTADLMLVTASPPIQSEESNAVKHCDSPLVDAHVEQKEVQFLPLSCTPEPESTRENHTNSELPNPQVDEESVIEEPSGTPSELKVLKIQEASPTEKLIEDETSLDEGEFEMLDSDPVITSSPWLETTESPDETDLPDDSYPEEFDSEYEQLSFLAFDSIETIEDDSFYGEAAVTHNEKPAQEHETHENAAQRVPADTSPGRSAAKNNQENKPFLCPFRRKPLPIDLKVNEEETDTFLYNLEYDNLEEIFRLPADKLEELFLKALQRYQFIGELPVSKKTYEGLIEYQRGISQKKRKINPRFSSPALFTINMVFCARYTETDARQFWSPYAHQVWGCEPSQTFMTLCRKLFVFSRSYLNNQLGILFDFRRPGDVVRPVYQHAIIPSYLQEHFAKWLVDNFGSILNYSADQLPHILKYDKSIERVPPRLRSFIRGEETSAAASNLIARMANAIKLFYELDRTEAVESVINSTFEKALWEVIYRELNLNQSTFTKLRSVTPKLDWRWDLDREDIFLYLSNIRSKKSKPNSIIWIEKDSDNYKSEILKELFPREIKSGGWELDPVSIREQGPTNGHILVLSANYNLDQSREGQEDQVIFEREVPQFKDKIQYFKVSSTSRIGIRKEKIESDGVWIIASCEQHKLIDDTGNEIQPQQLAVPVFMQKSGFIQANRYDIRLPLTIYCGDQLVHFDRTAQAEEVNPALRGTEMVKGMSENASRVFHSPGIVLEVNLNPGSHNFHRTWLLIRRNGELLSTIQLADLKNQSKLIVDKDLCIIDLSSYLPEPGAYSLNLLYEMKPLLEESLIFAWLPDSIKISEPDADICYSPINPLCITVEGVDEGMVSPIQDEKFKKKTIDGKVQVEWKMLKEKQCRLDVFWDNYPIHFCWDIDRVAAWIEGGGDKNQVLEENDQEVKLQARGRPNESISWQIAGDDGKRRESLNARGEYQNKLVETVIWDMLRDSDLAESTVSVSIRGQTWNVMTYRKEPKIEITQVNYQRPTLRISLSQERKLRGSYTIQVRNVHSFVSQKVYSTEGEPDIVSSFNISLDPGEYWVEVFLSGKQVSRSTTFNALKDPETTPPGRHQPIFVHGSKEHQYQVLTLSNEDLLKRSSPKLPIDSAFEQLKLINTPKSWVTNESGGNTPKNKLPNYPFNESFKQLLPTWAVLKYPLTLTTKRHQKILHVFPEKVAFGARAGRGYVDLKFEEKKLRASASWKPFGTEGYSSLWIEIPTTPDVKFYSELDENELWHAYQCKSCGTFVASQIGSYLQLSPSVQSHHQHGEDKNVDELFIDTVCHNTFVVQVSVDQYEEELLEHTYSVEKVVIPNYLADLIDGKKSPGRTRNCIGYPIEMFDYRDYATALDDLFRNIDCKEIKEIQGFSGTLEQLNQFLIDNETKVPAFAAMQRLMREIQALTSPFNIPGHILTLAMVLRMKPNLPGTFHELMEKQRVSEEGLAKLIVHASKGCPKLLEWCIAWAELFYVHAIS